MIENLIENHTETTSKKFSNITEWKNFINSMYGSITDETFTAPED